MNNFRVNLIAFYKFTLMKVQSYYAYILKRCTFYISHIQYFIYYFIYCFKYCLIYYLIYYLIFCYVLYCIIYCLIYCLIYYCVLYSISLSFYMLNILYFIFNTFSVLYLEVQTVSKIFRQLKSCLKFQIISHIVSWLKASF